MSSEALHAHVLEHRDVCARVLEAGGCGRCALRYTAPPFSLYELSAAVVGRALAAASGAGQRGETCPLCLGALDAATAEAVAAAGAGHAGVGDRSSWKVCVSVPVACVVRDGALCGHVGWPRSRAHAVKDAARFVVRGDLSRLAAAPASPEPRLGPVEFSLKFEGDAAAEIGALPARVRPALPRRPRLKFHERGKRPRAPQPGPSDVPQSQVEAALDALDGDELLALGDWFAAAPPPEKCRPAAACARAPTYFVFRYRKLSRAMPQSPWVVDGVVKGTASVEEVVAAAARDVAYCDGVKFAASGREDCDVRMRGGGRPAYALLENARAFRVAGDVAAAFAERVAARARALGAPVELRRASLGDRAEAAAVNASAETKTKTYACVVWCARDLTARDVATCDRRDFDVFQKTPVRVMHSRSLAVREKRVHELSLRRLNGRFAVLTIVTSAGMYIKEFVHGDLGRTEPSLASMLGARADILQLDVLDVEDAGLDS